MNCSELTDAVGFLEVVSHDGGETPDVGAILVSKVEAGGGWLEGVAVGPERIEAGVSVDGAAGITLVELAA